MCKTTRNIKENNQEDNEESIVVGLQYESWKSKKESHQEEVLGPSMKKKRKTNKIGLCIVIIKKKKIIDINTIRKFDFCN